MDNEQKLYDDNFATEGQLKRIADALEEVLRLVKEDQERTRKYMEKQKDEQKTRLGEYPGPAQPLAVAGGPGPKL